MLFETDFPHPTCQHPGPRTPAVEPEQYATEALGALPDDVLQKVLVDNAARLYGVPRGVSELADLEQGAAALDRRGGR